MRRIQYSVAMSLDGYIAAPGGEYDWIIMDPDIDFGELFARFDTLLIGRKTFEPMAAAAAKGEGAGGTGFPDMKSFVFSGTLKQSDHPSVTIVSEAAADFCRELREQAGKDICLFGGGELFRSLLAADLVDGVGVAVIPVLLGGGIPVLPAPSERARLTLTEHRVYEKSGIVSLEYAVTR